MSRKPPPPLQLRFVKTAEQAAALRDQGFEPIECAFGEASVLGPLAMDHHGSESWREGVARRAWEQHHGARAGDPRFVVTGSPDADAVMAIIGLAGLLPAQAVTPEFLALVDRQDSDPIGLDLLDEPAALPLLRFGQGAQRNSAEGFQAAIARMTELLVSGVDPAQAEAVRRAERHRREVAVAGLLALFDGRGSEQPLPLDWSGAPVRRGEAALTDPDRLVALTQSTVWGFDVWYRLAPVVVSFSTRNLKVTVGCPDRDTAERLFGPGGLAAVYPALGPGWGGRESVGGSPRAEQLTLADARRVASQLAGLIRR